MRGVAASDTHLGYTGAGRIVGGRNGRQVDVEVAWQHVVDHVIEQQPDMFSLAGDVFHRVVDPTNYSTRAFLRGIRRILAETKAHIVVIPGNHCGARTGAILSPNALIEDESDRVHYIDTTRRIYLTVQSGERVGIDCYPFSALAAAETRPIDPPRDADVTMMLIHAAMQSSAIAGSIPRWYGAGFDISYAAEAYDVLHAGDYHEFQLLHPARLAFYPGAIERTSSNIWAETQNKCVVLYDTAGSYDGGPMLEQMHIPTRRVLDYTLDLAPDSGAALLNEELQSRLDGAIGDAIVRVKVLDFDRAERDRVDWALVRRLKQQAFHFQLDIEYAARESIDLGDRRENSGRTLADQARAFFAAEPDAVQAVVFEHLGIARAA